MSFEKEEREGVRRVERSTPPPKEGARLALRGGGGTGGSLDGPATAAEVEAVGKVGWKEVRGLERGEGKVEADADAEPDVR